MPEDTPDPAPASRARFTGWRLWAMRLVLAVVAPLLFAGALELGLRVCGFGYATTFFIPTADGSGWTTNPRFCAQLFPPDDHLRPWPARLPARKPAGTLRIFILGESAAMGTPDPSFGFARILEVMLARAHPGRRFEVVNAAVRGVNSHVLLPIARECAEHEPDLFLIYMGNNEATGLYAPEPGALDLTSHLHLLRLITRAKMTRTAQLLGSPGRCVEAEQTMAFFRARQLAATDPRRLAILDNFRANLRDICAAARGAKVLVSTVAVNLRDCPPLGSTPEADAHFRAGRYALARDGDTLPFRADSRINDIIREEAAHREGAGIFLADPAQALGEPGDDLFYDHVHLRFAGDYAVAQMLLPRVAAALALGPGGAIPSRDECAAALAFNEWDALDMDTAIAQLTAGPPFLDQLDHAARQARAERSIRERTSRFGAEDIRRATEVCRAAVEKNPADWQLQFILGRMLLAFQKPAEAVRPLEAAVRMVPDYPPTRLLLAECLLKTRRPNQATGQLNEVLRIDPHSAAAHAALERAKTPR